MLGLDEKGELVYYYHDVQEDCYISLLGYLLNQLQQKENIIKEVREYIENNGHYDFYNLDVAVDGEKLLEILDKGDI